MQFLVWLLPSLMAGTALADTIYHCGYKNGAPVYKITGGKPGPGCRAINKPRSTGRKVPGAKCRSTRYRDTIFHCCDKDGIRRCFNRKSAVSPKRPTTSGSTGTDAGDREPVDDEPVLVDDAYGSTTDLSSIIAQASSSFDVPVALIRAVIHVESRFQADAVSPVGAQGLMQLMPVTSDFLEVSDPFDPAQNVMAGTRLLRRLADRYDGDVELTLAAYYAGPTAVRRAGGIPTEQCASYVKKVLARYREYSR